MMTDPARAAATTPTIPFAGCYISPGARSQALEAMSSGWLTAGRRTREFENHFAAWVGARQAVAVSSCTAAIELSLRALGLPPGSPVLTPTLTFCGAVHAIMHAGLRPVFVDVDEATLTTNVEATARTAVAARPTAMVLQHMAGYPADVTALADAAGLPLGRVVEDAAHGLGAAGPDGPIGTISGATCFSFYATKNLPIGEGGAITTADGQLVDRLRVLLQHGMSRDAWRRYEHGAAWRYDVEGSGLKANFTDLQAAIGLGQLAHLDGWQERRARSRPVTTLQLVDRLRVSALPPRPVDGIHAWHLYVIRVDDRFGLTRDQLAAGSGAAGIGTSVHFVPVHRFRYFRRPARRPVAAAPGRRAAVADRCCRCPCTPH